MLIIFVVVVVFGAYFPIRDDTPQARTSHLIRQFIFDEFNPNMMDGKIDILERHGCKLRLALEQRDRP